MSTQIANEEDKNNGDGMVILGVNIHCEGCANEVQKHLRRFEGVESVEIDAKSHKVTVKGEKVDPIKVTDRLRKKSGRHVELISPQPQKEEKKEPKKPEPEVIEAVLKIYIHCETCAKEVKHCILKMEGVQTVEADMKKNLVSVKGCMDPNKLVEFINKRGGRHAQIVKQTTNNKENEAKKGCCDCHQQLVFAPQLFSDENPNFCSLM